MEERCWRGGVDLGLGMRVVRRDALRRVLRRCRETVWQGAGREFGE